MSHPNTASTVAHEINLIFVIRLTCDSHSGDWRILLKPVNGEDARHFSDVEATLFYLEGLMTSQVQDMHRS